MGGFKLSTADEAKIYREFKAGNKAERYIERKAFLVGFTTNDTGKVKDCFAF
jgi:hypothetical protein